MTLHDLEPTLEIERPNRRVNTLSLLPDGALAPGLGRREQPALALVTAHTGVAIVRIEDERPHRVLIDPSRAVLVRSGTCSVVEAAVPEEQSIGLLEFAPALLETLDFAEPGLGHRLSIATPPLEVPWSSRLTLALLLLIRARAHAHAEIETGSPLADDFAALLHRTLADFDAPRGGKARSGSRAGAAHRELVQSAKMLIASAPERPHLLADIARAVSASAFHLEHVFQQQAGIPLHRFLLELRLSLAVNRLATDRNVHLSTLALSLGFATHSHFTAAFRRALGLTPTAARGALFGAPSRTLIGGNATRSPGAWLRILRTRAGGGPLTIPWHVNTYASSSCRE